MGRFVLVSRLAARDLRHRPVQAMLLLVVITASMATLTLGLLLRAVTSQPYQQTRAATAGPDVVASSVGYTGRSTPVSPAMLNRFAALAGARGVIAHSGPYPVAWPVLRTADGMPANVMAEGRDAVSAAVDQPEVVQGTWVRPGGVVLERAFADALGVGLGDRVTLSGKPFRVIGIAVTAAVPVYSQICFFGGCSAQAGSSLSFDTGLAWLTRSDARALAAPGGPLSYYLNLRLADPAAAPAFVDAHQPPQNSGPLALTAWQSLRDVATHLVQDQQQVLAPASLLLGLLAVASIAVVAGARIAEQDRRVGLLKAVGGTPALAAAVLLAEHAAIALAAAAAGLAAWLAAPLLTGPGASLVGSPGAPSLTITTVLIVVGAAVAVTCAATLIPAVRAARVSTVSALAAAGRTPRRWAWLVRASAWLPVPLLLAVRLTGRRPRRALLSAASFTVTATTIVAVFNYHATTGLDAALAGPFAGPPDPMRGRISTVLLVVTIVTAILAAANAIFTTWATVVDSRHLSGIVRSLGATPGQAVAGLSAAQLLPALAGALLGIPAGNELYAVVQGQGPHGTPPAWWLLTMVLGMLLAAAMLAAIPARAGARQPVAQILRTETA